MLEKASLLGMGMGLDRIQLDSIGSDGIHFLPPKDFYVLRLLLGSDLDGSHTADRECLSASQMPPP